LQHYTDPETGEKRPGKGKSGTNNNGKRTRDAPATEQPQGRDAGVADDADNQDIPGGDPTYQPGPDIEEDVDEGAGLGGDGAHYAGQGSSRNTRSRQAQGASPEEEQYPSKAAREAAQRIRNAALAGPTLPERKAIPAELTNDEEVRAEIERKSLVKETLEMKQNLAPIWVMCEKCVLYIQHGMYPTSPR
jgi:hypothetical protein